MMTDPVSWRLGRWYMLRVAGLPVERLEGLRFTDGVAWADAVIAARDRLAADGQRLSDLLHEYIGDQLDESDRRPLLAARRQLFNNRLPKDAAALRDVPGDLGAELDAWLRGRAALDALTATGKDIL